MRQDTNDQRRGDMSERTYALRKLRAFVEERAKCLQKWKAIVEMTDEMIEDNLFAVKIRRDECREIIQEIDRMLKFKKTGRKKP